MGGNLNIARARPNDHIPSTLASSVFEQARRGSTLKNAKAPPHPSPFTGIDIGAVTHISDVVPNGVDSPHDSLGDMEMPEERRNRLSSVATALRDVVSAI